MPNKQVLRNIGSRQRQGGYLLVSLLLALTLAAILIPVYANYEAQRDARANAREIGALLSQYDAALRNYLSDRGTVALTSVGCAQGAICKQTGTSWLKNRSTCAAATGALTVDYIPCGFPDSFYHLQPVTYLFQRTVVINGQNTVQNFAVTDLPGITDLVGQARPDLTAEAAEQANQMSAGLATVTVAGGAPSIEPVVGAFYQFYPYNPANGWNYNANTEAPQPKAGDLIGETNSAPSLDAWLRTDGSNQMHANLNMGGNDIVNVRNVYAQDVVIQGVNGGQPVSSFWSNRFPVSFSGQTIPKPSCAIPGEQPEGVFVPSQIAYFFNNDPPNGNVTPISSYQVKLNDLSNTQWQLQVLVTTTRNPSPAVPVALTPQNSVVTGKVLTRCAA